jgi:penicillin-insensitive murein endopeptidase
LRLSALLLSVGVVALGHGSSAPLSAKEIERLVPRAARVADPPPAMPPVAEKSQDPAGRPARSPAEMDAAELAFVFATNPEAIGSLSWGRPNHGALINAVPMPDGPEWRVVEPERAFGTEETIDSISRAIRRVNDEFPMSPPLFVGNISARRGGYLRPHRSHQSGRDADLGFYYQGGPGWYQRATAKNLDRARTWALVKALLEDPNVESIFVDRSVQNLLRDYAERAGESYRWLDGIFRGGLHGTEKRIFHEWGHLTHLHVRFRCPMAQETAARVSGPIEAMLRAERAQKEFSRRHGFRG